MIVPSPAAPSQVFHAMQPHPTSLFPLWADAGAGISFGCADRARFPLLYVCRWLLAVPIGFALAKPFFQQNFAGAIPNYRRGSCTHSLPWDGGVFWGHPTWKIHKPNPTCPRALSIWELLYTVVHQEEPPSIPVLASFPNW